MNNKELYEKRARLVPNALGIFNPSTIQSAKGAIITDVEGRELIDFAGGIGVVNAGHCPPSVVKAIQEQAEKFIHAGFNVSLYDEYLKLAEKLAQLFPHGEHTKVMLTNSGAESVENAVKFARQATGKSAIICYNGSFHGRTLMAMTLTSNIKYKEGCGPYAPEVYRLEFPYFSPKEQLKWSSEEQFVDYHIAKLHSFFGSYVSIKNTAAIIMEIVQGEGGFTVVPKSYLQYLRKFCTDNNILLIIDEVQSGFGRTCDWSAYQQYGITPDISTWAKSMGSGMPIGAVIGKAELLDKAAPSTVGGTYLGNPLACASALATIKYMEEQNINEKAKIVAQQVKNAFLELQHFYPEIVYDVRGMGAMLAMELRTKDGNPNTELVRTVIAKSLEKGVVVISAGTYGQCIRVLSPLLIEPELLEKGLTLLKEAVKESI